MRFSIIATIFAAGAVMAESTVYTTEEVTITSCAPTVTNCPARSTVTSVTSYPVVVATSHPVYANTSAPLSPTTKTSSPETTSKVSLSTLTISTCVPTVIYSVVTVKPTTAPAYSTGIVSPYKNSTTPVSTAKPTQYTGAASNVQGTVAAAAAMGLAALIFA